MRILALDVGERRIGMAMSDPMGMLASPFGTLEFVKPQLVAKRLEQIISENEIGEVLVGMPLRTDGTPGEQAEKVRAWAQEVSKRLSVAITFVDERFSTKEAAAHLRESGDSSASMRDRLDAAAATIILQSYMDQEQVRTEDGESKIENGH